MIMDFVISLMGWCASRLIFYLQIPRHLASNPAYNLNTKSFLDHKTLQLNYESCHMMPID